MFFDIFSCIFSKNLEKMYNFIHLFSFLLILIACISIQKFYLNKDTRFDTETNENFKFFKIGLFVICVLVIFCYYFDIFLNLKFTFKMYESGKKLDILNYFLLILFLFIQIRKFNDFDVFLTTNV